MLHLPTEQGLQALRLGHRVHEVGVLHCLLHLLLALLGLLFVFVVLLRV